MCHLAGAIRAPRGERSGMNRRPIVTLFLALVPAFGALAGAPALADPPAGVTYLGDPAASISAGVALPAGTAMLWLSGTPPGAPLGDMKLQSESILAKLDTALRAQGMSLRNVVYLRVYLVADKTTAKVDYKGWFDAYAESFGTAANPAKPARSTIAVASLVNPEWLIEIEAFAAYPKK
jgi:enamine deaminase RidA (YjgF/YER057c/UK114 family)